MAHTSIHGADSAPRGGPTLSKFAVEVQLSAPSPFDGRRQQNYASYQYQSQNLPPLPSNPATQLPLNLTNDYVAYNAVPATTTAVAHGNGDERVRAPRVDYQVLLLALAEEYLEASHKMGWAAASGRQERDLERYYKLIATGLGCLESLLQRWRLQPHSEALVRLRYATVLYEETENIMEAEITLCKGIALCTRNRFVDLKHSMQHLLARVLFKKNPKASLKLLDGVIEEVEAYRRIPWVYMLRFLRVSLCLELSSSNGINNALHSLRSISSTARDLKDTGILLLAAVLEASVHLFSNSHDNIEQAQRAIATARSLQLTNSTSQLPQLVILTQILDLLCSLMEPNPQQATVKMHGLIPLLEQVSNDPRWRHDGTFSVMIDSTNPSTNPITSGILSNGAHGIEKLTFSWLSSQDVRMLGGFLCGVTLSHMNSPDPHPAEKHLQMTVRTVPLNVEGCNLPQSLSSACTRLSWRRMLDGYARVHLALLLCCRAQWAPASTILEGLRSNGNIFETRDAEPLASLVEYLGGVICQGTGKFNEALSIFRRAKFDVTADHYKDPSTASQRIQRDLAVLATLNTILIIRSQPDPDGATIQRLISNAEPFCASSSNRGIHSALNFIRASSQDSQSMLSTKKYLEQALTAARNLGNNHLVCMSLALLTWKFLRGVIGTQAEKGAKAALAQAKTTHNDLWISVCKGMFADTLEVQGKIGEARVVREEARQLAELALPGPP